MGSSAGAGAVVYTEVTPRCPGLMYATAEASRIIARYEDYFRRPEPTFLGDGPNNSSQVRHARLAGRPPAEDISQFAAISFVVRQARSACPQSRRRGTMSGQSNLVALTSAPRWS